MTGQGDPLHAACGKAFARARRAAQGLAQWPGALPQSLAQAYAIQAAAGQAWGKRPGGVKVGRVLGDWADQLGVDRFLGPICAQTIQHTGTGNPASFPIITGGTALLECEIIAVLGADAPAHDQITPLEARDLVASLHIGIEIAGSPMADINPLGPLASIACFGNNNGAIVGPAIAGWRDLDTRSIGCTARIDGVAVGQGDTGRLPGGLFAALAFACAQAVRIGQPLRAGDIVCSGALTGMHPIAPGQHAEADFGPLGQVRCQSVAQAPEAGEAA
ncbi:MAG TPA: fumarylacetoacetate hydrolase family protein [Novosphingobium sp.]|nr:fumarylacetoacetate hydrolase family protein [Novosphingobium sp.]